VIMTPNSHWLDAAQQLSHQGQNYVLVTLLGVRGSAPRDSGTKMVVSVDATFDTIGGGHLEHKATQIAQQLMIDGESGQRIEHFPLSAKLGQCCGGNVSVLFETFINTNINIMMFGAGHVGHAIAPMLSGLPVNLHWVDERQALFPPSPFPNELQNFAARNVQHIVSESPSDEVATMPANSYYIVLTHNHQRDFEICSAILKRADASFLGLIGSDTKWKRFKQRFAHRGFSEQLIDTVTCPVGLSDVPGKLPMEVAVSIVAQVINLYQQGKAPTPHKQGIEWSSLKNMLDETALASTNDHVASLHDSND
jgi:xanthine dehydrogenase accessory factor